MEDREVLVVRTLLVVLEPLEVQEVQAVSQRPEVSLGKVPV
jgi:hypothetical protein